MSILANLLGRNKEFNQLKLDKIENTRNENRIIRVRFPSMAGDTNRSMTIQELKENYKNYLIIDPTMREQVDIEKLANLDDIQEVVAMPPIAADDTYTLSIRWYYRCLIPTFFTDEPNIARYFDGYIKNKELWNYLKAYSVDTRTFHAIVRGEYPNFLKDRNKQKDLFNY